MTYRFAAFVRGSKDPMVDQTFKTYGEALQAAEDWAGQLGPIEDFRYEGYIADDKLIRWHYPKALKEMTFDTVVTAFGNSLSITISKQAQIMGLRRDEPVNVTLRRITEHHEDRIQNSLDTPISKSRNLFIFKHPKYLLVTESY